MKKLLFLVAAVAAGVPAGGAFAQDAPVETDAAPEAGGVEASAEDAAATDDSATAAEKTLERDLAMFWGKRREVKVVQKRQVEKDGRFELALTGGIIPNDDFIVYYPVGGRVGYHFSESFSVEAAYAYSFQSDSGLTDFLTSPDGADLTRAVIQQTISMYYNIGLNWAPIYGKVSLLGMKLVHFESYVGLGVGAANVEELVDSSNPNPSSSIKPAGNVSVGFRWFVDDTINVRTEYRHHFLQGPEISGGVYTPAELTLAVGFML
ncbi:MAG: outer membrane beta-barrel domain-containing protein [Myxococcales bacterium]|nr:outer membrane beta-barrel domain-containing protein [Myxococcales bacterium]MCB9521826.1 outer membrane beta-barrel domain-containing protein [Myxococcales bacterium]